MKTLKTTLITFLILLFCSVSAMADNEVSTPTLALNANGQPTVSVTNAKQITSENTTLQPGTAANPAWYWAGGTTQDDAVKIESSLTIPSGTPGTINIVVGPNGQAATDETEGGDAMTVKGSLNIPSGVTVNVYQAANATGAQPPLSSCYLSIEGTDAKTATGDPTKTEAVAAAPGITVGGELNIISGAVNGTGGTPTAESEGSADPLTGILVNAGGKVTVSGGELQATAGAPATTPAAPTAATSTAALTISPASGNTAAGSISANGGFLFCTSDGANMVGAPISGLENLTVNGGTVWASDLYSSVPTSNLIKGSWVNYTRDGDTSTSVINSFGSVSNGDSTFSLGVYDGISFKGTSSFTINSNANVTIPNGMDLTFGTAGAAQSSSTDGQLTVAENASLILSPQANITMNTNSKLQNNGTIDVGEN